jgi:threonylcarbamoyladenosine tRNA methylthiotransferase CDKAL1
VLAVLPTDGSCMLRVGMTNPPFILDQLGAVAAALNHPCVFAYLHVPVQSGADPVLHAMNREYTVAEFEMVCASRRSSLVALARTGGPPTSVPC